MDNTILYYIIIFLKSNIIIFFLNKFSFEVYYFRLLPIIIIIEFFLPFKILSKEPLVLTNLNAMITYDFLLLIAEGYILTFIIGNSLLDTIFFKDLDKDSDTFYPIQALISCFLAHSICSGIIIIYYSIKCI